MRQAQPKSVYCAIPGLDGKQHFLAGFVLVSKLVIVTAGFPPLKSSLAFSFSGPDQHELSAVVLQM